MNDRRWAKWKTISKIERKILLARGERVMIDADLAESYGVSTKRLNEQVRRNAARFPGDFAFRLDPDEKAGVVAKCDHLSDLNEVGRNALLEQGGFMRSFLGVLIMVGSFVAFAATAAPAQQLREKDPTPFERPKPIATIASESNGKTIGQLKEFLAAREFTIVSIDRDGGEISVVKKDTPDSTRSDRVLIWLERDPAEPAKRARIYMLFGRFESFMGSTEGPVRVRMYDSELARMTQLQDAIVEFANAQD